MKFTRDKGGIGTFEFADPIDSDLLKERFEFPILYRLAILTTMVVVLYGMKETL